MGNANAIFQVESLLPISKHKLEYKQQFHETEIKSIDPEHAENPLYMCI